MIVYISSGHWSAGMICLTHTVPNINDINSQKILSMPIYMMHWIQQRLKSIRKVFT